MLNEMKAGSYELRTVGLSVVYHQECVDDKAATNITDCLVINRLLARSAVS